MNVNNVKTVYLAGPCVFLPDADEIFKYKKQVLLRHNFLIRCPLDNDTYQPKLIVAANIKAVHECDIVLANLIPFRGTEPDAGTVFEIGMAIALGKRVVAYNCGQYSYIDRVRKTLNLNDKAIADDSNYSIEDFNHTINIMLAESIEFANSFEHAVEHLFAKNLR